MLGVKIICCGTIKEQYLKDAIKEYEKRLSAFCRFSIDEIKEDSKSASFEAVKNFKGYKIALCIEGKQLSSEELSCLLGNIPNKGFGSVCFVIGGSEGIDENIKEMCDFRLSFSKMTFPHQLMRVILIEQIYRGFTILNNQKYHK